MESFDTVGWVIRPGSILIPMLYVT